MNDAAVITAYYAAFQRADWDGMCTLLAEDVIHDLNQGGREIGRAEFRRFMDRMAQSYREQLRDITVMSGPPGRAAAEYIVDGEYIATDAATGRDARGQRYSLPGGAFFELRDGLIHRVTNYYNLTDWLRQVHV